MVLSPWSPAQLADYVSWVQRIQPQEIHLNTPTRPKPLQRELDGRSNHPPASLQPAGNSETRLFSGRPVRQLKCVSPSVLAQLAQQLHEATQVPVRHAPVP